MPQTPYEKAIALLARREHSYKELSEKLSKKFPGQFAEISNVLKKLVDQGYQSDRRFAEAYANMRTNKGFGPERIALELHYKGISNELTECVLAELPVYQSIECSPLFLTWQKKFKSPTKDLREKQKQIRYLRYRGFSADSVNDLFRILDI